MTARGWLLFGAVSVLWGVPYLFIKLGLEDLDPLTIAAGRILLGGLALLPLTYRRLGEVFRRWRPLVVLAMVEVAAPFTLISVGELSISSGLAGVLIATEPMFVVVLGLLIARRGERPTRSRLVGLAVGLAGVVLLLGIQGSSWGAPLVLAASACYALGALLVGRWFAGLPTLAVVCGMLLTASVPVSVLAAAFEPAPVLTADGVLAVLILGLACTAGGFTSFFTLIHLAGAARAAVITYVAPIVATGCGVLVLDEVIGLRSAAGIGLILAGAYLATRSARAEDDRGLRADPAND